MSQLTICFIIFILTIIGYCSGLYSLASIALTSMMCLTLTGVPGGEGGAGVFRELQRDHGRRYVRGGGRFNRTKFCTNLATGIVQMSRERHEKMMVGYVLIGVLLSQFIQSPVWCSVLSTRCFRHIGEYGLKAVQGVVPRGRCDYLHLLHSAAGSRGHGGGGVKRIPGELRLHAVYRGPDGSHEGPPAHADSVDHLFRNFRNQICAQRAGGKDHGDGGKEGGEGNLSNFAEIAAIVIFFGDAWR